MTKKDYELIANQIDMQLYSHKWQGQLEQEKAIKAIAHRLSERLALDDPKFNKNKFLQACGIETDNAQPQTWEEEFEQHQ